MKEGDLIKINRTTKQGGELHGILVKFLPCNHAKQWPKVEVLTESGLEEWITQYCEVVDETR